MRRLTKLLIFLMIPLFIGITLPPLAQAQHGWDNEEAERPSHQRDGQPRRPFDREVEGRGPGQTAPFEHGQKRGPAFMEQMVKNLDLDEKQREELKKLMKQRRESGAENPRMRVMRSVQELNDAIADGSDETIKRLVDEIREASLQAAKTSREFQKILTEEQRAKLNQFRERFKKIKGQRREDFKDNFRERAQRRFEGDLERQSH